MSLNERERGLKELLKSSCPLNLKCGIIDDLGKNSFYGGIGIAFGFVGVQLNRM